MMIVPAALLKKAEKTNTHDQKYMSVEKMWLKSMEYLSQFGTLL